MADAGGDALQVAAKAAWLFTRPDRLDGRYRLPPLVQA